MGLRETVSLLLLLGLSQAHRIMDLGGGSEIHGVEDGFGDMTSTILTMNNGSTDLLVEGDVWVSRTRSGMKCYRRGTSCLWPKSQDGTVRIPFLISNKYDTDERSMILTAMEDMSSNTCIDFIPRVLQEDYLSIEPRFGCYSFMGFLSGKQRVSLQRFGCVQHGVIQHELMHALGFYHEHTRSDRDDYVRINWDHVPEYSVYNFQKQDTNNLDLPYDYSSIMHYGRKAFTNNYREETITPIPDTTIPIGQRTGLSDLDFRKLNRFYRCENERSQQSQL